MAHEYRFCKQAFTAFPTGSSNLTKISFAIEYNFNVTATGKTGQELCIYV